MTTPPTRRERVRLQTLDEIKHHALEQVAAGGPSALSLNAIAKAMGMSGPAIYRYFASREALLGALVTDGYAELAQVVVAARAAKPDLLHVAGAYRAWAVANPYRYELLFSVRPPGYADPDSAIVAIEPAMQVLLDLLAELVPADAPDPPRKLVAQLRRWSKARGTGGATYPPAVLLAGVQTWTRLHGLVTLELSGAIGDMGLDPALLLRAELDALVSPPRG